MSERDEFEACPFCGGGVAHYYEGSHDWVFECSSQACGAHVRFYQPHTDDEAEAVKARWNARAPVLTDEQIDGIWGRVTREDCRSDAAHRRAFARAILAAPQQAVPALRDDTWERFAAWLLDHCEGQVITEEFLHVQLGKMLAAAPQPSPEKCFRCGHAAHHGSCVNEAPRSED